MKYKRAFGQKKCVPKKRALKSVRKFSLAKNRVIEKVSALKSERSKKWAIWKGCLSIAQNVSRLEDFGDFVAFMTESLCIDFPMYLPKVSLVFLGKTLNFRAVFSNQNSFAKALLRFL